MWWDGVQGSRGWVFSSSANLRSEYRQKSWGTDGNAGARLSTDAG